MIRLILLCLSFIGAAAFPCAGFTTFRVAVDPTIKLEPGAGRLVIFLIPDDSPVDGKTKPIDGPFTDHDFPIFALDVPRMTVGAPVTLNETAAFFPTPMSKLAPGGYRAQALFDMHHQDSKWRREAGNAYSKEVHFVVPSPESKDAIRDTPVDLVLSQVTREPARAAAPGLDWFSTPSKLLSEFRKEEVTLRAGVVFPTNYDPKGRYAAIYFVPGFGGDDRDAPRMAASLARGAESGPSQELARSTFLIVLNAEGPNGHNLFADSANNGPCAQALIGELIPALEAKYPLIARPEARLLRGHSSGGWSTLWLALQYPKTFGATWSSSPDPVDFRAFQTINIYEDKNFYVAPDGSERPSTRSLDRTTGESKVNCSVRRESRQEDILSPDNTSAQQWDSWAAVAGPRNAAGHPAALFDPETGQIDHSIAEQYRKYDIGLLVRSDPDRYLPILQKNVRLICGGADNFYLNLAVQLFLKDVSVLSHTPVRTVDKADSMPVPGQKPEDRIEYVLEYPGEPGYIKLLPGYDHGTIFGSPQSRAIPQEMVDHLKKNGLAK
ncbi:MAG: alpha/beta hydrolase-fold protein [Phycisphaerales bacterium]|nr:hypothetical protein [Planctomycetota bacterium]